MKFYLLQLGHSHSENTLHAFETAEQRDAMTKELIYGPGELSPDDQRGLGLYLEELREDGSVEFEGDPGLEWFTAHDATADRPSQGRARFSTAAWDAIEVLEKELAQLGCKRLVLQPGKKFESAIAYEKET